MFTGIIETIGTIKLITEEGRNKRMTVQSSFAQELRVDQSISHDGVCLTVERITENEYEVVAIEETLTRSHFKNLKIGSSVNLERSLKIGDRLDGHFVQGHVDQTALCKKIENKEGSHVFTFQFNDNNAGLIVDKGSITINGVSLTVVESSGDLFSVAIIPYTYNHTNFKYLKQGELVNLEFDVIGKYVRKLLISNKGVE